MEASQGSEQVGEGNAEIASAFRHYARELYRFCLRWTGNAARAEEALAEVFLQACTHQEEIDFGSGSLRAWLYGVARNVLQNQRREEQRQQATALRLVDLQRRAAEDAGEEFARRQVAQTLLCCLGSLPEAQRQVVVLCVLGDRSYEAAARDLDVPIGTVRSRLYRARLSLALAVRAADGA
jgi:RNA polymerase sigma factor (sigma-70 family)